MRRPTRPVNRTRFTPRLPRTRKRAATPQAGAGPRTTKTTRPGALSVNVIRAARFCLPCRTGRARIPVTRARRVALAGRLDRSGEAAVLPDDPEDDGDA